MKLPKESEIADCIIRFTSVDNSSVWFKRYIISSDDLKACVAAIMNLFLKNSLNDNDDEEAPDIDPNLVKIAELEAKIRVYESVIDSAGIKLGMPKKNSRLQPKSSVEVIH